MGAGEGGMMSDQMARMRMAQQQQQQQQSGWQQRQQQPQGPAGSPGRLPDFQKTQGGLDLRMVTPVELQIDPKQTENMTAEEQQQYIQALYNQQVNTFAKLTLRGRCPLQRL